MSPAPSNQPALRRHVRGGGVEVHAWEVFPAAAEAEVKKARRVQADSAVSAEEASCFSHPAKRAVDACSHCGAFVCGLCSIPFGNRIICPACVAKAVSSEAASVAIEKSRPRWDRRAVSLLVISIVLPVIGWFVLPVAAPLAAWWAWISLRQPPGPVPASRGWVIAAFLLAVLGFAGGVIFDFLLLSDKGGLR